LTSRSFILSFCCAAVFAAAQCFPAAAEPMVRVKAKLTAFDGQVMSLQPLPPPAPPPPPKGQPPAPAPRADEPFKLSVMPQTRYVASGKASFADLKVGDYAGAAVTVPPKGDLIAQDVFVYAPVLRGTGEGRFSDGPRLVVNGTVKAAKPGTNVQAGTFTLHYRGASLGNNGPGKTLCEGRAMPAPYASALACEGDAIIDVAPGTPVSALTVGDKSLLVVGRIVTVSMTKTADGKTVSPGVVVEVPPPVEKPQTPP
jgi:hypothetical protein